MAVLALRRGSTVYSYMNGTTCSNNKRPQYIFIPDFWMFVEDDFKIREIR